MLSLDVTRPVRSPTQGLSKSMPIELCVCTCVCVHVLSSLGKLPERGETNIRVKDRDHQGKFSPKQNGLFPNGRSHHGNQVTESGFGNAMSRPSMSDFLGCSVHELNPTLAVWVGEPAQCPWMFLVVLLLLLDPS